MRGLGIKSSSKKFDANFSFKDPVFSCKWYHDTPKMPIMKR